MSTAKDWLSEIATRMKTQVENGAAPTPEKVTVKELLARFNCSYRTPQAVNYIRNLMEESDLQVVPDITAVGRGSTIGIELDPEVLGTISNGKLPDPTYRVDMLVPGDDDDNRQPLISVKPDRPLTVAVTIMQMHDFSQLPVMDSPQSVKGVIS